MAYRFLLEVPDALYNQANMVITATDDADIVDVHEGIGGDFYAEGKTITMLAYSLEIVERLATWYADAGSTDVPVAVVLTNGTKMVPGDMSSGDIVAAIRRDQPWVERSIPKIGDHATTTAPAAGFAPATATAESGVATAKGPRVAEVEILATDEPTDHPTVNIDDYVMLHLPVIDLARPERAYAEVFGARLVGQANRDGQGGWEWLDPHYDVEQEAQFGTEPDYAFLQNGSLSIALERVGRAYPLDVFANPPLPIRLLVSDSSYESIKAEALARNWNVFDVATPGVFGFRDPFGYTWAIHSESFEKGETPNA